MSSAYSSHQRKKDGNLSPTRSPSPPASAAPSPASAPPPHPSPPSDLRFPGHRLPGAQVDAVLMLSIYFETSTSLQFLLVFSLKKINSVKGGGVYPTNPQFCPFSVDIFCLLSVDVILSLLCKNYHLVNLKQEKSEAQARQLPHLLFLGVHCSRGRYTQH